MVASHIFPTEVPTGPPARTYPVKAPPPQAPAVKAPPASSSVPEVVVDVVGGKGLERDFKVKFVEETDWVVVAKGEVEKEGSSLNTAAQAEARRLQQQAKRARRQAMKVDTAEAVALKESTRKVAAVTVEGAANLVHDPFRGSSAGGSCAGGTGAGSSTDGGTSSTSAGSAGGTTATLACDPFRGSSAGGSCVGGAAVEASDVEEGEGENAEAGGRSMKGRLECSECGMDCPNRSEFLLVDGGPGGCGASWQGKMWGHCQTCSGLPLKAFTKKAKKAWAVRANSLRERVKTVRCVDFDNATAYILKALPKASQQLVRHLANSRLRCATMAFAASVAGETPQMLELRERFTAKHLSDCKAAAADPENAVSVEGRFLDQTEVAYLTTVAKGITVSFGCRYRHCLWFGLNHEWAKQLGSEHFRCPCCGLLYQPTAGEKDRAPFSFVLSMPDVETGEQIHVPAAWPDGEDHKWLMQSIEAYAIAPSTKAELEAYDLKTLKVELHDLLDRVKVPSHFKEVPWNEQAMVAWPSADFDWSLYRTRGTTWGCKLDRVRDAEAIEHPFTEWPLLIAMVGRVVAMTRAGDNAGAQSAARAMTA